MPDHTCEHEELTGAWTERLRECVQVRVRVCMFYMSVRVCLSYECACVHVHVLVRVSACAPTAGGVGLSPRVSGRCAAPPSCLSRIVQGVSGSTARSASLGRGRSEPGRQPGQGVWLADEAGLRDRRPGVPTAWASTVPLLREPGAPRAGEAAQRPGVVEPVPSSPRHHHTGRAWLPRQRLSPSP